MGDTWIPNICWTFSIMSSSKYKFRVQFNILFMSNADPRQSTVTLLSSSEPNILCLTAIVIVGFSGMDQNSREHVGRGDKTSHPPSRASRPGPGAGTVGSVTLVRRPVPRI